MGWYWRSQGGVRDALEFRERFPSLALCIDFERQQTGANGILALPVGVAYDIRIQVPRGYPEEVPSLICSPQEVPKLAVRHNSGGSACLAARCDYRKHWPRGSTLAKFVDSLVIPFLTCQYYYDIHGHWPSTGERDHCAPGILQAYVEFCEPLGNVTEEVIVRVIRMLVRTGLPKSHHPCPCGSGKPIRDCHRIAIERMRQMISPHDAAKDLAEISSYLRPSK